MGLSLSGGSPAALIAVAVIVAFFGFLGPVLIERGKTKERRAERAEDRADRARVAQEAKDAAAASQRRGEHTAGSLAELKEGQSDLKAGQKVIHTLVNQNMTDAIKAERDATVREVVLMKELIALKQAQGQEPSPETLATLQETEQKIHELQVKLAERHLQDVEANKLIADAGNPPS